MALGFPRKKKTGIVEVEGKCQQDCNCMFHLGFCSAAKTIALLECQASFHVNDPTARGDTSMVWQRSHSHGEI